MYAFTYQTPNSLEDAARAHHEARDATFLAGGMTLIPTLKLRLAAPSDLIDLGAVAELKTISIDDDALVIGAMVPHAEVAEAKIVHAHCAALARLAGGIGDPAVRERGTIGGSIANNDPAADYPAALLALDAVVMTNKRSIDAHAFFLGMFETALNVGEIVTAVRFPRPERAAYAKFSNPASRYATVGVMVAQFKHAVRVAVTGAGPCVFRASEIESRLQNDFCPAALSDYACPALDLNDDDFASAEYRAHLVKAMAVRAVDAASALP